MTPVSRPFRQVDVFTVEPTLGNPVAVVFDADDLTDVQMASFARWTNLSETTFVLAPTVTGADYRLRIFTPGGELPFAGHPTLGSAYAWLERGGAPAGELIVQECGIGLVDIRRGDDGLAFAAPALLRSGPVDEDTMARVRGALGVRRSDVVAANWVSNGPEWLGVMLTDAATVLALRPDFEAMGDLKIGVIGAWREPGRAEGPDAPDYEVRGFVPGIGVPEDPVTGSLNAGLAVWLRGTGEAPASYVAAQGTALARAGRVHVVDDGDRIWVGGSCVTVVSGTVAL